MRALQLVGDCGGHDVNAWPGYSEFYICLGPYILMETSCKQQQQQQLKRDREIVSTAIRTHENALQYAAEELKRDGDFVHAVEYAARSSGWR